MADVEIRIGDLRWPVMVARRRQNFDPPGGTGIFEDYVLVGFVRASVDPIKESSFFEGIQVDTPVTTRITTRWLDYIDNTYIIIRDTLRWNGSTRTELFRIRLVKEINGRKRFTSLLCELEKVT